MQLFVSNRYERLYKHLRQQLFEIAPASACEAAFTQRFIVTPSLELYRHLTTELACDPQCKIAMGVQWLSKESLHTKMAKWFALRDSCKPVRHFPQYLELVFMLENALKWLLQHSQERALNALFSNPSTHVLDTEKRVRLLAETLTTLFLDYGRYGADFFESWQGSLHPHAKWQKELWEICFGADGPWGFPYELAQILDLSQCIAPKQMQLHLFCHTELSLLEQTLLEALALQRPVCIYQLTPTRMYWEDLLSPRSQLFLRKSWEERHIDLEELKQATELLQEPNTLLARLGQALKMRDLQLSARVKHRHEDYAISERLIALPGYLQGCDHAIEVEKTENKERAPTLLEAVQGDFLTLRKTHLAEPTLLSSHEDSIQLHAAPTPMREVEVVCKAALQILRTRPQVQSGDIALYVVDLPRYLPFLRGAFEKEHPGLKVDYLDVPLELQSPYVQAFLSLVRLVKGRFSARELLDAFESPHILAAATLSAQDLKQVRRYISQAPIYWGETPKERADYLQDSVGASETQKSGVGTWQQGMTQLFVDLVMGTKLYEPREISFTGPCMEKWLKAFRSLQSDIQQLKSAEEHTLPAWAELLRAFATRYLDPLDRKQERDVLFEQLDLLGSGEGALSNLTFSFASILPRLEWLLYRPASLPAAGEESVVTISSLRAHQLRPARIIGLIGLEEGAFPRLRHESPLDLLKGEPQAERRPKPSDQERALLLEALLLAKEALLISYCAICPQDGKVQGASLPVAELMEELNLSYVIAGKPAGLAITRQHPLKPYDPRYFCNDPFLSNPAKKDYELSRAYTSAAPSEAHEQAQPARSPVIPIESWALHDLKRCAQDPCALYLKEQLGVKLLDPQRHLVAEEESFVTLGQKRYLLQERCLKGDADLLLKRAAERAELPFGLFGKLSEQQIQRDVSKQREDLKRYQIKDLPQGFTLHPTCAAPTFDEEALCWHLPAYRLQAGQLTLTGTLEGVTPKGLLLYGSGAIEERAVALPLYLTYLLFRQQLETLLGCAFNPNCLSLDKQQSFASPLTSTASIETALMQFIAYAEKARLHGAPVHKDWLKPLIQGDLEGACHAMQTALENKDLHWRYRHILQVHKQRRNKDLRVWLAEWMPLVQAAFAQIPGEEKN